MIVRNRCSVIAGRRDRIVAQISAERIIQAIGDVPFEFFCLAEFDLRPATHSIECLNGGIRIIERTGEDNAATESTTEPSNGAAAIEFTRKFPASAERNGPIRGGGPSVGVSVDAPILPAVVSAESQCQIVAEEAANPSCARGV